ncbi:calcium voltage-gated channel subunit alpha1 I, partial [Chelydra serpentina]
VCVYLWGGARVGNFSKLPFFFQFYFFDLDFPFWRSLFHAKEFSFCASMAEYVSHPSSAWHSGRQPPHTSALCPLELMDLGVTEQVSPLEQPPPSLELGDEEDINSPLDPDVPYPDLAPVVFFCLKQTTSPRNWCIKMVCN